MNSKSFRILQFFFILLFLLTAEFFQGSGKMLLRTKGENHKRRANDPSYGSPLLQSPFLIFPPGSLYGGGADDWYGNARNYFTAPLSYLSGSFMHLLRSFSSENKAG